MDIITEGYCQCGCGQQTTINEYDHAKQGAVKGESRKFILGHHNRLKRKSETPYVKEDRGHSTPCWIWQRSKTQDGYGVFRQKGIRYYAHRWYYAQKYGPIPDGHEADHLCDQPECCNPDHMKPATHKENCRRGRGVKLDWRDVEEIKRRLTFGESQTSLAKEFGVHQTQVSRIWLGKCWA